MGWVRWGWTSGGHWAGVRSIGGWRFVGAKANPLPERALPGRGSPFLEKGRKSTRGSAPGPRLILAPAMTGSIFFRCLHSRLQAVKQATSPTQLRRRAITWIIGDSTCCCCSLPFLSDHPNNPGFSLFCPQQLQEIAVISLLEAALSRLSG